MDNAPQIRSRGRTTTRTNPYVLWGTRAWNRAMFVTCAPERM